MGDVRVPPWAPIEDSDADASVSEKNRETANRRFFCARVSGIESKECIPRARIHLAEGPFDKAGGRSEPDPVPPSVRVIRRR